MLDVQNSWTGPVLFSSWISFCGTEAYHPLPPQLPQFLPSTSSIFAPPPLFFLFFFVASSFPPCNTSHGFSFGTIMGTIPSHGIASRITNRGLEFSFVSNGHWRDKNSVFRLGFFFFQGYHGNFVEFHHGGPGREMFKEHNA